MGIIASENISEHGPDPRSMALRLGHFPCRRQLLNACQTVRRAAPGRELAAPRIARCAKRSATPLRPTPPSVMPIPDLPQGLWDDALDVWQLRYASREVLRQDARCARLKAIALELVTTPPGEKRNALAAEIAQLVGPRRGRPEPPDMAVWADG